MTRSMLGSGARALFGLLGVLWAGLAFADARQELVVDGRVVNSEPVLAERRYAVEEGDCAPARPAPGAGLVDVLRWDLRADCRTAWRTEEYIEGWRVWYQWEDEVYSSVFDEKPGKTVPLRLTLH